MLELLNHLAVWDSHHLIYLAEHGYSNVGDPYNYIVFLPFYPFLSKIVGFFTGNYILSSYIVSWLSLLTGLFYFYKLLKINNINPYKTILTLLSFPSAFVFLLPLTESTFFMLLSVTLYLSSRHKYALAGLFAGLCTITRMTGFVVAFTVFIEFLQDKNKRLVDIIPIFFPSFILGMMYLGINNLYYGDPLQFQTILREHWHKYAEFFPLSIGNSWITAAKYLTDPSNYNLMIGIVEAVTATLGILLIPVVFRFTKRSWAFLYTVSIIITTSTSLIISTPRYLLSMPFFLIPIAKLPYKFWIPLMGGSLYLLYFFSYRYNAYYWVF